MSRAESKCRRALLAVVVAAVVGAVTAPAAAAQAPAIQPGVAIRTGDHGCTLNWIYDRFTPAAGNGAPVHEGVYAGTAAHCVDSVGQDTVLLDQQLGNPVLTIGQVAFIAPSLDYAFIRIDQGNAALVNPALKGHPQIPTGMSTTATSATGDVIQFSGNGVGFHPHQLTQERRQGVLHSNDGTEHEAFGPVTPGDSGGPVADVTDGNKALGIVNWLRLGVPHSGEAGLSLEGMLADALARGWDLRLRTI
jgi:hypothetical protein